MAIGRTSNWRGGGEWAASVQQQTLPSGSTLSVPPLVTVPGSATVTLDARAAGTEGEVTGFVVLTRGADRRRIPFWGRVTRPLLGAERSTPLTRPGLHAGNNRNHPAKVSRYRYPETPTGGGISATLAGPEQVFSVRLTKAAANFGVAITSHAHGVRVEPRIVAGGDENSLEGETAIPLNYNTYLRTYGDYAPAAEPRRCRSRQASTMRRCWTTSATAARGRERCTCR